MSETDELITNVLRYSALQGITIENTLGYGNDGKVWSTNRSSAIKALYRQGGYDRGLAAYCRLDQLGVANLEGFSIPQHVGSDDSLLVIEMTIVFPPCILDFAKSYVDHPPRLFARSIGGLAKGNRIVVWRKIERGYIYLGLAAQLRHSLLRCQAHEYPVC